MVDFLIVGQGIAGSMLAYFLHKADFSFQIIDKHAGETSSRIAAGLINPITGRRFVKSWMIDDVLPFAKKTYREIEELFGIDIVNELPVHRVLHSIEQENDFLSKKADRQVIAEYLTSEVFDLGKEVINPYKGFKIFPALQVNSSVLISTIREQFSGNVINEIFDVEELKTQENSLEYKNIKAKNIIFCDGAKAEQNPFFNYLPFNLAKGEALIIETASISQKTIISSYANLVPLGNELILGRLYLQLERQNE